MESNTSMNSKLQNPSGQPPGAFEIVRIDFFKYLSPGAKIVPNLFVRGKISDRDFLHMDQTWKRRPCRPTFLLSDSLAQVNYLL